MNSPLIQLLVLAGIAVFLILRLRSVLGTREGFEKPAAPKGVTKSGRQPRLEVIEGGPDRDITDHVAEGSPDAQALSQMKEADPSFGVASFLGGARSAYEMILMGFERGDLAAIKPFLSAEVYDTFAEVVEAREAQGLKIEAEFVGVRELAIAEATFDPETSTGEISVRFVGELTSVVRDSAGDVVEGSPTAVKRQKDVWTFARRMGTDNPNWLLIATGE